MKKFKITIIGLLISVASMGQAHPRKIVNNAYIPGEIIKYSLHYGWIEGGTATLQVNEEMLEGKKVFHAVAIGQTTGVVDKLFNVHDIFESYYDPSTGLPVKKIRNIHENKYRFYNEARFDRIKNTVTSLKSGEKKAPEYILDVVSVFYYLRCLDISKLKNGDVIKTVIFIDDRIFPFDITYRGKETLKTDKGYISCHKFMPYTEPGSVFKEDDDMTVWFSADSNMVPIRISLQMLVGSVDCDLMESTNLRRPLVFSKKK